MKLSFRWRLILLNSIVVFLMLILVGSLLIFTTRTFTLKSLDNDLRNRIDRMSRTGPGPGGPRGPYRSGAPEYLKELGRSFTQPDDGGSNRSKTANGNLGSADRNLSDSSGGDSAYGGSPTLVQDRSPGGPAGPGDGPQGIPGFGGDRNSGGPPGGTDPFGNDQSGNDPNGNDAERPLFFHTNGQPFPGHSRDLAWDPFAVLNAVPKITLTTVSTQGRHLRVATLLVKDFPRWGEGDEAAVIQIAKGLEDYERLFQILTQLLISLTPLAMLIAGLIGGFLADQAIRPVSKVTAAAAKISDKDLTLRLIVSGDDELAKLAKTFNEMVERLNLSFAQRDVLNTHLERALEEQKRFVADASHELRTPLARLRLVTSATLSQHSTEEEMREALQVADKAAESMTKLITQLLVLARQDATAYEVELKPISLCPLLEDAAKTGGAGSEIPVKVECGSAIQVLAESADLSRAISNLVENACRYSNPGSEVIVAARQNQGEVEVIVRDFGKGIPPEHLPHLTERFYRVEASRARKDGGCGLGLAITKAIIERMNGKFLIESQVGKGTTCRIFLKNLQENS